MNKVQKFLKNSVSLVLKYLFWTSFSKIKMLGLLGFGFYQPILTRVKVFQTYFVNLGESLKGVSDDWRTLIMNRKSRK